MAVKNTEAKRLAPSKLKKAQDSATTLRSIAGYSPVRTEFDRNALEIVMKEAGIKAEAELQAQNALDKARDAATKAEWDLYNFMQGAAEQVVGQYGSDSDEYASLGYKKKSEYKKGARPKKP